MKTYCGNGLIKDVPYYLDDSQEFGIQEMYYSDGSCEFAYQRDDINYDLDNALISLYDLFRDLLFEDLDRYNFESCALPIWVTEAGQSSYNSISSSNFR